MAGFKPPREWPNAKAEARLWKAYEQARTLADVCHAPETTAVLEEAAGALFRAYHVEMEARLALWRSLGYEL